MAKKNAKKSARVISSKVVYKGPAFHITADTIVEPGGVKARRDIIRHGESAVVLAVDDTGPEPRVLLVRQYRHPAEDYLWELCAGGVDEGESELEAAKRELLEETGYAAEHWERLLKFYVSPGFLDETMAVFLARGLRKGKSQPEADELINKRFYPLSTALGMIVSRRIQDAKTICGLLWLQSQAEQREGA